MAVVSALAAPHCIVQQVQNVPVLPMQIEGGGTLPSSFSSSSSKTSGQPRHCRNETVAPPASSCSAWRMALHAHVPGRGSSYRRNAVAFWELMVWNLPADGALLTGLHLHQPRQSTVKRSINGTLPQGLHDAEASPLMDALTELELVLSGKTSDPVARAKAQGTAGVQGRAGKAEQAAEPQMAGPQHLGTLHHQLQK